MIDYWKICCCLQYPNGEIVDKELPFKTMNIVAKTADEAKKKIIDNFNMCKVTFWKEPKHISMTEEEYNGS